MAYLNTLGGAVHYWIGITQIDALHFEWVDGSPLESPNWGDKFDPHDERTNCIRMDSTLDWQWYDKSCGFSYNYICEAPLAGSTSLFLKTALTSFSTVIHYLFIIHDV